MISVSTRRLDDFNEKCSSLPSFEGDGVPFVLVDGSYSDCCVDKTIASHVSPDLILRCGASCSIGTDSGIPVTFVAERGHEWQRMLDSWMSNVNASWYGVWGVSEAYINSVFTSRGNLFALKPPFNRPREGPGAILFVDSLISHEKVIQISMSDCIFFRYEADSFVPITNAHRERSKRLAILLRAIDVFFLDGHSCLRFPRVASNVSVLLFSLAHRYMVASPSASQTIFKMNSRYHPM